MFSEIEIKKGFVKLLQSPEYSVICSFDESERVDERGVCAVDITSSRLVQNNLPWRVFQMTFSCETLQQNDFDLTNYENMKNKVLEKLKNFTDEDISQAIGYNCAGFIEKNLQSTNDFGVNLLIIEFDLSLTD